MQRTGEDGCGGMTVDSGIVMEDLCGDGMENLGGRLVSILMRVSILVGGVVVVAVMVLAVGIVSFSEEQCLSVTEVEY